MINTSQNQYSKLEWFIMMFPSAIIVIVIIPMVVEPYLPVMDKLSFPTLNWWIGSGVFWIIYLIILNIFVDVEKVAPFARRVRFLLGCVMVVSLTAFSIWGLRSALVLSCLGVAETQTMSAQIIDGNIRQATKGYSCRLWVLKLETGQQVRVCQSVSPQLAIGKHIPVLVKENEWGIWVKPDL